MEKLPEEMENQEVGLYSVLGSKYMEVSTLLFKSNLPLITFLVIMIFNCTLTLSIYSLSEEIKTLQNELLDKKLEERTTIYYPSFVQKPCHRDHYTRQDIDNLLPSAEQGDCDALSVIYSYSIVIKNQPDYDKFQKYVELYKNSQCSGIPCVATFDIDETTQTYYLYPHDVSNTKSNNNDKI